MLELCTGGHLGHVLNICGGQLKEEQTLGYIQQLCKAVAHCHNRGICHRDIKLQNVLLESSGRDAQIKLVDFGNAVRFTPATLPMQKIVGTTYTTAPEVFKQEYDQRCDVWSIGVVTYVNMCCCLELWLNYVILLSCSITSDVLESMFFFHHTL